MRTTFGRVFIIAAAAVVVLGIGLSFRLLGTPAHARLIALDDARTHDLSTISVYLYNRYGRDHHALPARLPAPIGGLQNRTSAQYVYRRVSARKYHLCATFASQSDSSDLDSSQRAFWKHHAGKTCYALDASSTPPDDPPSETEL